MKNKFGWNETEQDLVRIYKKFIQPKTDDNEIFPEFIDNENDKTISPVRTRFKFGKRGWIGIPNLFARNSSDIPTLPHFSFGDKKGGKYNVWLVISGDDTIKRFLRMSPPEEEKLIEFCRKLSDSYDISVKEKIKEHHFLEPPDYKNVLEFKANTIDSDKLKKVHDALEKILDLPRDKPGMGIFPKLDIRYNKLLSEGEIHKPLLEMKKIFVLVSKIKTEKDEKREEKEGAKKEAELKNKLDNLHSKKRYYEKVMRIPLAGDKEEIIKKIEKIENQISDLEKGLS